MHRSANTSVLSVGLFVLLGYACTTIKEKDAADGDGDAGEVTQAFAGSGAGGNGSAGRPEGDVNSAGEADNGGSLDTGGGGQGDSGSHSGDGGVANEANAGAAGGLGEGGNGEGDGSDPSVPTWLDDLPGPETDAVTELDFGYVHANQSLFGLFVNADDEIVIAGWPGLLNTSHRINAFVAKLNASGASVWSSNAQYPDPNTLTGAYGWVATQLVGNTNGVAFIGGIYHPPGAYPMLPNETAHGLDDLALGAYSDSGAQSWLHQVGSSESDVFASIAAGPNGSVYQFAEIPGQLPGKPATVRGGPAVIKYDAAGAQVWATQYKNLDPTGTISIDVAIDLSVDNAGNAFGSDLDGVTKVDSTGAKTWYHASPSYHRSSDSVIPNVDRVSARPSGEVLFSYGSPGSSDVEQFPLQKWDADTGAPLWIRTPGKRHVTIEPVEGVIWNGQFTESTDLLVTDTAVYLTGHYANTYVNGSTAKPKVDTTFVARYDLAGKQVWFRQFTVKFSSTAATGSPFIPVDLALRPNGDLVLAGNTGDGWLTVKLKAKDGSVE